MESILGKDCTRWWINFIKEKKSNGLYHDNDCIAVACLKFCFMSILWDELHRAARLWSLEFDLQFDLSMSQVLFHVYIARWTSSGSKTVESRIWPSTNLESPSGRPDVLSSLQEVSGTRNCIIWMSTWTNWILLGRNAAIDVRKVIAQMNLHSYQKSLGKKVYNFLTHLERQQLCMSPHLKK